MKPTPAPGCRLFTSKKGDDLSSLLCPEGTCKFCAEVCFQDYVRGLPFYLRWPIRAIEWVAWSPRYWPVCLSLIVVVGAIATWIDPVGMWQPVVVQINEDHIRNVAAVLAVVVLIFWPKIQKRVFGH
jgi:hypothetical protein